MMVWDVSDVNSTITNVTTRKSPMLFVEASPLFLSAEALYLSIHNDFTKDLATAPAAQLREELKPNATLVHLTNHPERIEARRKLLADRGIAAGNERTITLPWTTVVLQDVK